MWVGMMNWPLPEDWECESCGARGIRIGAYAISGFTWGLAFGTFRCDQCHTQYTWMKDGNYQDRPICRLREEYRERAKAGWEKFKTPLTEWTDEQWEETCS